MTAERNEAQVWLDGSVERPRDSEDASAFEQLMNQPGEEVGPLFVGEIEFETGLITVCDHWTVWPEEGLTLAVRSGTFRVFVKGKDFDGERRIASLTLIDSSCVTEELRTQELGEVAVDSWGLIIGEYKHWHGTLSEELQDELSDNQFGKYPDGCELFELSAGGQEKRAVRCFTGFGSGAYPVDALWDGDHCVGLAAEFIYPVS